MTTGSADDMPLWGRLFLWAFVIVFLVVPLSIVGLWTIDEIVRPTPAIVRDLTPRDHDGFTRRLDVHFPRGITELEVVDDLDDLGFEIDKDARRARFVRSSMVCSEDWIVDWTIDADGNLATIMGYDMGACL